MSKSKYIDRICAAAAILALAVTAALSGGFLPTAQARTEGYASRLFDPARVHTLDLAVDGWEEFLASCENEDYVRCAVIIDGESYQNVGLRAKGNTSLTTVSSLGSSRYSWKIEFDHYEDGSTYHGLDKLCLNNIIQDNTYLKDYLTYRMMGEFGVAAPLCSFVYITVNGEDWGLYLAVEGVEDAFLRRNFGQGAGALYKPDSMSFGGGPGNGRNFFMEESGEEKDIFRSAQGGEMPDFSQLPEGGPAEGMPSGGGFGGMGAGDVKLQYLGDDPGSYENIFQNAKTKITKADESRLIAALKSLSEGDVGSCLDVEQVLRYFAVHNYVVNGDSYTGGMVHNYYLYEEDGRLAMIPWDYNLAFGGFQGGSASAAVNDPIDTPLSVTGSGDRPMADWIGQSEEYTALYHQYLAEFLTAVDPDAIIQEAYELIAPYVEKDPTKFCTVQEFESGVEALRRFCALRGESVAGQLEGRIPATSAGQEENGASLVDASALVLSDMGGMMQGGGAPRGGLPFGEGEDQPDKQMPQGDGPEERQESFRPAGEPGFRPEEKPGEEGGLPAAGVLAASVLVLLGGLLFAFKFKR